MHFDRSYPIPSVTTIRAGKLDSVIVRAVIIGGTDDDLCPISASKFKLLVTQMELTHLSQTRIRRRVQLPLE